MSLRVSLTAADPIRRLGLTTLLAEAGHVLVTDAPEVVLFDAGPAAGPPPDTDAPMLVLGGRARVPAPAGLLARDVSPEQLDAALRAVAVGLLVRAAWPPDAGSGEPGPGFAPVTADETPLTPRETEILLLIGQGLSNKAIARRLAISVHTVKFHIEALFGKLAATSRAEAVAKGLTGGVIEL